MSSSKAKTGEIAAKAGASAGGTASKVEADNATSNAGAADIAGDEGQKPTETAPKDNEKAAEAVVDVVKKAAETIETVVKAAAKLEKPANTQKVKILRSHPAFAYHPGEEGELSAENAEKLVADGFAQLLSADGEAITPTGPSQAQLASAKSAYERFVAVADAETKGAEEIFPFSFADLPHPMQCAFVAAIDPTYSHQAE